MELILQAFTELCCKFSERGTELSIPVLRIEGHWTAAFVRKKGRSGDLECSYIIAKFFAAEIII